MKDNKHYIVLDNTALDYDDYYVTVENGNLYISGSYVSYETAVFEFYKILDRSGDTLSIDEGVLVSGKIDTPPICYENKQDLLKIFEYLLRFRFPFALPLEFYQIHQNLKE